MKAIARVRVFWSACIAFFLAAVVGLQWGAQLSVMLLPASQRPYADSALLHAVWMKRSIFLFLMCAACGLLGIYFSLRAADAREG